MADDDKIPSKVKDMLSQMNLPSPEKAAKILEDGEIDGEPITDAQRKLFGLIADGKLPTRLKDMPKSVREKVA